VVRARRRSLALAAVAAVIAAVGLFALLHHGAPSAPKVALVPTPPGVTNTKPLPDPFAWTPARSADFARRAATGTSHVLYTQSPGGVALSAARTERWRPQVERAAKAAGVDPDRLEALVFLESAGRPDVLAPGGIESAAGLTQILAETGRDLLGMHVDTQRSARYTRRIAAAQRSLKLPHAAALARARARVDDRFDPAKALAGTARYLAIAKRRFGREDLAFVSYHMGIGNLESVLQAYDGGRRVPYAQLYFDSTPTHNAAAYRRLAAFGDDSRNYYWKLSAAMAIMRLARHDPAALTRTAALQTGADSAWMVLHPPATTHRGKLLPLPDRPQLTGLRVPAGSALAPPALALALYVGAQTRAIGGAPALDVLATAGQGPPDDPHAAGWTFNVARVYASQRQALAFQYVLDRLQVLNVIAWSREGGAIQITAASGAAVLEPLIDRLRSP
jgi:hypothetical protein